MLCNLCCKKGVAHVLHYLDDFLLLGTPGISECQQSLQTALEWCSKLGSRTEDRGPSQSDYFSRYRGGHIRMSAAAANQKIAVVTRGHKVMDKAKLSRK